MTSIIGFVRPIAQSRLVVFRHRLVLCALMALAGQGSVGCGEGEPPRDQLAPSPPRHRPRPQRTNAPVSTPDRAPTFEGTFSAAVLGLNRVHFEWEPASDDHTPAEQLLYVLHGTGPGQRAGYPAVSPFSVESRAGATSLDVEVPDGIVTWHLEVVDEANHRVQLNEPIWVLPRPQKFDWLDGQPEGELQDCRSNRVADEPEVWCVGEFGRYSVFRAGNWTHHLTDFPFRLSFVEGTEELLAFDERHLYRASDEGTLEPIDGAAPDNESAAFQSMIVEPTGLLLGVDVNGGLWLGDEEGLQSIPTVLLNSEHRCARPLDIHARGQRALLRCRSGQHYSLRPNQSGYAWQPLAELQPESRRQIPVRSVAFGDGREVALLTWQGDIERFDLGGWQVLRLNVEDLPATALAPSEDGRNLQLGQAGQRLQLSVLGEHRVLNQLTSNGSLIYLPPQDDAAVLITSMAEVFDARSGEARGPTFPTGFTHHIRSETQAIGFLSESPTTTLVKVGDTPSFRDVPTLPSGFSANSYFVSERGELWIGGDLGAAGGAVVRVADSRATVEPFV
ncbi:MAG: hypothetical protein KC561_02115, partial [Myxococcales bacterium]|nr:hypothetical protein [Myxococcales bacterium]